MSLPPLPKEHVIDVFFDFIRTEDELNPVLCGYFAKTVTSMVTQHRKACQLFVFNPANRVVEFLVKHVYNRSLADLLIRLLNQDVLRSDYADEVIEYVMTSDQMRRDVVLGLIAQLRSEDEEGRLNAAMVLMEVFEAKKNFKSESTDIGVLEQLFQTAWAEDDVVSRSALRVINTVFTALNFEKNPRAEPADPFDETDVDNEVELLPEVHTLLKDQA